MREVDSTVPLVCVRCHMWKCTVANGLCSACDRQLVGSYGRKPMHRPLDYELSPWQENAIRHWEDAAQDLE